MELIKLYDEKLLRDLEAQKLSYEKKRLILDEHVKNVLPTLNKSKLKSVDLKGHQIDFFVYWNKFIGNNNLTERELGTIVNIFSSHLSTASAMLKYSKNIMDAISTGFSSGNDYCRQSGKYIMTQLNNKMEFVLKQYNKKTIIHEGKEIKTGEFVELTPNPFVHKTYEKIVNFPSGNLIINDYFRCDKNEFHLAMENITEEDDYSEENSINYPRGVVKAISDCADFDFVSVNVFNTSPSAFKYKDKLIFGELHEEKDEDGDDFWERTKKDPSYLGKVCTDLWNVSIIDEEIFVNILMSSGLDETTAKKHLDAVKKRVDIKIKVKPGKYRVIFCGYCDDFDKLYRKKNKDKIPKKYKPYFIVEKV